MEEKKKNGEEEEEGKKKSLARSAAAGKYKQINPEVGNAGACSNRSTNTLNAATN